MESISRFANRLEKSGLQVTSVRTIEYGYQIRLECGAIINVYKTGKVLVQGKLDHRGKDQRVYLLQQLLPTGTKFPPSMVPEVKSKTLIRDRDGNYVDAESPWYANNVGPLGPNLLEY